MYKTKNKALLMGTITYAIGTFGTKILSFLIVPLYTYFIIPEDLGDYDLLITTVSLLSPILTLKISEATYRWIINNKDNEIQYISATYNLLIKNSITAAIVLLIINKIIPIWHCYYFITILIGDRVLECLQKLLRGLRNQKLFAVSGVFHTCIFVFSNLYKICYLHEGVIALLQSNILSVFLTIIFILVCEPRLRKVDIFKNYWTIQKELLSYSAPLVPSALCWWMMNTSDRYVIRLFLGRYANGIYSVAYKFPSILTTVFNMFNNAWTDMALAEIKKGETSNFYVKSIFQKLYKMSFSLAILLIPLTKLIMKLILSSSYKEGAIYVGFLYIGTVFQGLSTFCGIGYLHNKETKGAAKTSIIGAIANIIIDLLFIKSIGLFAASISTCFGFMIMWLLRMKDFIKVFPFTVDWRELLVYSLTGIFIASITIWTNNKVDIVLVAFGLFNIIVHNRDTVKNFFRLASKRLSQTR